MKLHNKVIVLNPPSIVAESMEQYPGYLGMNQYVVFPAENRSDDEIAAIIEFDGNESHPDGQSTLRTPSDNLVLYQDDSFDQTLNYTYALITTNHYLKSKTAIYPESTGRYITIKEGLVTASADGNVSINEAVQIMGMVGHSGTVHTTVFKADEKQLHVNLAEPGLGGFDSPIFTCSFNELF